MQLNTASELKTNTAKTFMRAGFLDTPRYGAELSQNHGGNVCITDANTKYKSRLMMKLD